jgi:hydroxyacylglutathione hydrolase
MPLTSASLTRFVLGPLETNTYVLLDKETRKAAVIDPAGEDAGLFRFLETNASGVEKILLTHGHFDHIGGVPGLKKKWNADVCIHPRDVDMLMRPEENLSIFLGVHFLASEADLLLEEGMEMSIGTLKIRVLHTPGHTPGSVCFEGEGFTLVGDTLFRHSVGRTDFPGSSMDQLLHSIRHKLLPLGDSIRAFPGHGEETTLGHEREHNPFLAADSSGI